MFKRIRDRKRFFKPLGFVSAKEWEEITSKYQQAQQIKKSFIYSLLIKSRDELEKDILQNRLRDVHNYEFDNFLGVVKSVFITQRRILYEEAVGRLKTIYYLLDEIEKAIRVKEDMEKKEADGDIIIEGRSVKK